MVVIVHVVDLSFCVSSKAVAWCVLLQLSILDLEGNHLNGTIPAFFSRQVVDRPYCIILHIAVRLLDIGMSGHNMQVMHHETSAGC